MFVAVTKELHNARPNLIIDFVGGPVGYGFRHGTGRNHLLAKAAGLKGGKLPTVVDATAGLGRDAFLLASLGARVTLIERSPEVHALLHDALKRASAARPELAAVIERMTLIRGDARELLPGLRAEVILVDPMHPPRGNTALIKQQMRLLRELAGTDADALQLIQVALQHTGNRVVLKWPRYATMLPGLPQPSHQILGKTVRYDVFMVRSTDRARDVAAN